MLFSKILPLAGRRELLRLTSSHNPPPDFSTTGPKLIVALAADYGNLGDVALTRVLLSMANEHLPSHAPYLLSAGRIFRDLRGVARASGVDDVVAVVGGGNMGDRYRDLEEARCHVIRAFRRQRIVSFPQSFDFSGSRLGRRMLAVSSRVYASHPRLVLFARELESLRRMREHMPDCRVELAPDTVLSLDRGAGNRRNLPLLICLRHSADKEARLGAERREAIVDDLCTAYPGAVVRDTIVPGARLRYRDYIAPLDSLWSEFARAQCVVTDRLHGLIFAVISRTPCVVIENSYHKIRSTYSTWLEGRTESVHLLTDPTPENVRHAVASVTASPAGPFHFPGAFEPLFAALRG